MGVVSIRHLPSLFSVPSLTVQHVILSNCANLYNSYVTAVALEALYWRYYVVFVGLNIMYGALWYIFGVETRGRTLEEIDAVFDAKFPPRTTAKDRLAFSRRSHLGRVEESLQTSVAPVFDRPESMTNSFRALPLSIPSM